MSIAAYVVRCSFGLIVALLGALGALGLDGAFALVAFAGFGTSGAKSLASPPWMPGLPDAFVLGAFAGLGFAGFGALVLHGALQGVSAGTRRTFTRPVFFVNLSRNQPSRTFLATLTSTLMPGPQRIVLAGFKLTGSFGVLILGAFGAFTFGGFGTFGALGARNGLRRGPAMKDTGFPLARKPTCVLGGFDTVFHFLTLILAVSIPRPTRGPNPCFAFELVLMKLFQRCTRCFGGFGERPGFIFQHFRFFTMLF
jgi:hypothetical protein